ncbi:MAG: hypothetical protein AAGC74_03490, partial [Verrucomicrobiota bacterium]
GNVRGQQPGAERHFEPGLWEADLLDLEEILEAEIVPEGMGEDLIPRRPWMELRALFAGEFFKGHIRGSEQVTEADVFALYGPVMTEMEWYRTELALAFFPTEDWLFQLRAGYLEIWGLVESASAPSFEVQVEGLSDVELLFGRNFEWGSSTRLQLRMGVELPTGSVEEVVEGKFAPPALQLGTGALTYVPGLTVQHRWRSWHFGVNFDVEWREGANDRGYDFGTSYTGSVWANRQIWGELRLSGALLGQYVETLDAQPLNPGPLLHAQGENYGGHLYEVILGARYGFADGRCELGASVSLPIFESANGIRLEKSWGASVGLSMKF